MVSCTYGKHQQTTTSNLDSHISDQPKLHLITRINQITQESGFLVKPLLTSTHFIWYNDYGEYELGFIKDVGNRFINCALYEDKRFTLCVLGLEDYTISQSTILIIKPPIKKYTKITETFL